MTPLASDIYLHLQTVPWLSALGRAELPSIGLCAVRASDRQAAEASFRSDAWADAKTEAQGDLTGYLAKNHYSSYGGSWNGLVSESRVLLEGAVGTQLSRAVASAGLPADMLQPMLIDLNRAVIEISFRRRFPKAPSFFEQLLKVYEAGRLPCGWQGDMRTWPKGVLVVF